MGQKTKTFELKDKVAKGSTYKIDDNSFKLYIGFPELSSRGELFYSNNEKNNQGSKKLPSEAKFYYIAGKTYDSSGKINIKFAGYSNNDEGRSCIVNITVKECYEGCGNCTEKGTEEDNKCLNLDCLNEKDYYPVFKKQSNCLKKMLIIIIIIQLIIWLKNGIIIVKNVSSK